MADPDDDLKDGQKEHRSYFGAEADDEGPESRYEPVEVDLSEPEPKKGEDGRHVAAPAPDPAATQLRAQLNEARQQTAMAQRQAMELAQRAQDAEQRAMGSTVGMIDSALEAAQGAAANAKAKFQAALDAADHRTAAQAQEEMADARHNLLRLQEQRAYVQAEAQRPPTVQRQAPQQAPQVDQITRELANTGFPRSADWLRAHHEWASRPDLLERISAADRHLVTNKGFVRETDEYFTALEQELGMGQQQQRRSSSVPDYNNVRGRAAAAPTSNSQPSLRNGQTTLRGRIALTPAQQEAAELSGMTNREYAESFEEARVAGKLLGYR